MLEINGLVCLLQPQNLRLNSLDGLSDVGAESELADRKFLESREMLDRDANDGRQHPGLVLCILPIDVAGLALERVHQQIGDQGAPEALQRTVPAIPEFGRERNLELPIADRCQHCFIVVKDEIPRRLLALSGKQGRLVVAVEMHLVVRPP